MDHQYDKLFKVLSPDLSAGFMKNDLVEFLSYLEQSCGLTSPVLSEAELKSLCKEASIKEVKNTKGSLN